MKSISRCINVLLLACLGMIGNLNAQGRKEEVRITCVGASITAGHLTTRPETDSYPAQLGTKLGEGYRVTNYGVGGSTMLRKGDYPYWEREAYPEALASNPDIVFIDLGGNDSKAINRIYMDEFVKDACDMVISFAKLPSKPRIILLTPIVSFYPDSEGIYDEVIRNQVAPATIEAARKLKIEVLDMHPVLDRNPELVPDGIHPNTEGSEKMAQKMYDYLMRFPKKPSKKMTVDGSRMR